MTHIADGLIAALGRASWQGALVLLGLGLLCRALARRMPAHLHCGLWRVGYVKLLVGLAWGGAVLLPLLPPLVQTPSVSFPMAVSAPPPTLPPSVVAPITAATGTAPLPVSPSGPDWPLRVGAAYLLGVVVCLGRMLGAARRTRRVLLRSVSADVTETETQCLQELAQALHLRRVPALARSADVESPVLLADHILLPATACYGDDALRMILAHELAHVRRRDLLWEWLGTAVQAMFFFHPLVLWARREERLAREAAADALAVQVTQTNAAAYGRMLLSVALSQGARRPLLAGSVGVVEGGTLLRRRLLALRDAAAPSRRKAIRMASLIVPLALLTLIPWQMTRGQARSTASAPVVSLSTPFSPGWSPILHKGDKQINGIVYNEKHEPVAGIIVSLNWHWSYPIAGGGTMGGSDVVGQVSTDSQGHFSFAHLSVGGYDYHLSSPTNQYVPMVGHIDISKTDTSKTVNVVVSRGSLITGRVVDRQTGKPMAGVFVGAGSIPPGADLAQWESWPMPTEGMTNSQGVYQVRVMPGEAFVGLGRISASTLLSQRIQAAVQRVMVQRGQTASAPDLDVSLHPIIICVGPDGKPVTGTTVRIIPADTTKGGYLLKDETDMTGTVVLDRFDSGTFSIEQEGRIASGTYQSSSNGSLIINMDGQTRSYPSGVATISLADESAAFVTGKVVDDAGNPIANAVVHIDEIDPKSRYVVENHLFKTNASGIFRVPLNPADQDEVYVRADGFNQAAVSGFNQTSRFGEPLSVVKGKTTDLGTIHLVRAKGFVSGRVVDSSGKPMAGVLAFVRGGKTFLSSAVTDAGGNFRIPNVVMGEPLRLHLCLHGASSDSGQALSQSNEEMVIRGVQASPATRTFVWRPD